MPERSGYIASGILHLGLVLLFVLGLPNFFRHHLPEATPLVVQLVKIGPETRATQLTKTPPTPEAKPEVAEQVPQPKPEPPAPEPPKIVPHPEPPLLTTPPEPQLAQPEPPPPAPQLKPQPPAPPPPVPTMKPAPPDVKQVAVAVPPPKPQPPKPKPDQVQQTQQFDTLLKNLAKNDPARNQPDQPKQNSPARRASSQPVAPLGPQLTASELDLVKQQIEQCWNVPLGARDAQDLTPEFRVTMNPDATVRSVVLLNTDRYGDPTFRAAADSARRALFNPACSPLKLPLDKFNEWQTFTITFDPKDVAG